MDAKKRGLRAVFRVYLFVSIPVWLMPLSVDIYFFAGDPQVGLR